MREGDDLEIIERSVQRRADRRATRQCAKIQGNLASGAGGDRLPIELDGEDRGWLVHQVEQRSHLPGDLLHWIGKLLVHAGAPPCQAAASSGAATSVI
jgi:hypothetical protein